MGLEVEYWAKVDEFKDRIEPKLMHYEATHIVIVDDEVIGTSESFAKYASATYESILDVDVMNTVVYNRNVRENFFEALKNNGNPMVYLELGLQDAKRANDFESMGGIYIEL
jgi:nucleoside-triphosphatase THEP1